MTVVASVAVSIGPVVCRPRIVAVMRIRPAIAIRIIAGAIWIVTGAVRIVTVSVSRIAKSDSNASNANRDLTV
jgi:hypothetical protein